MLAKSKFNFKEYNSSWQNVMKWFQREVQGIEAEAKRFIDESFKYLRSAEGAFDLLLKFQHIKSRKAGLYGPYWRDWKLDILGRPRSVNGHP